ncbi:hypothetical protein AAG906_026255 [Vitis piasezkii]
MISISFFLIFPSATSLSFNLTTFDQRNDNISIEGDAGDLTEGCITLTKDSYGNDPTQSRGRAFSYGDGLAFFLNGTELHNDTWGGTLGLANENNETKLAPVKFIAVEFDTYRNPSKSDPAGDHVGIDINSMISVKTVKWSSNITGGKKNHVSISYTSSSHNLSVVLITEVTSSTNTTQSLSYKVDLREYLPENVKPGEGKKTGLMVGLSVGAFVVVGGLGLVWYYMWKKRNTGGDQEDGADSDLAMDEDFEKGTGPRKFSFNELALATIKRVTRNSQQGMKEYASEVKIFCRLRHRNLVQLMGWCHQKGELLLVYELLPNGSLSTCLFEEKTLLTWAMRYRIALGLASSLLYLHEEWEQCVVHRDIKSSNVMLDSDFNAKLGDFGLARLVDHGKGSQTTVLAGTMGYMAPECFMTGKASKESDVYSFGIVALEICCGRRAVETKAEENQIRLVEWVWDLYGVGKLLEAADPRLSADYDDQQMERLMIVGLWCAHPDCNARPSMREAISVLNSEALLPLLPIKMPVPMYYAPPALQTSYSTSLSERNHTQFSNSSNGTTDSSKVSESSSTLSQSASLLHTR